MSQKTVTIGGVKYDAHTGLRLDGQPERTSKKGVTSASATAHDITKKPSDRRRLNVACQSTVKARPSKKARPKLRQRRQNSHTAQAVHTRSPMIRRFASHDVMPVRKRATAPTEKPDTPATKHPVHKAAKAAYLQKSQPQRSKKHRQETNSTKKSAKLSQNPTKINATNIYYLQRHPRLFSIATAEYRRRSHCRIRNLHKPAVHFR